MKKSLIIKLVLVGLGGILLFGSVKFQNLEERREQVRSQQFSASDYARDFWDNRLPDILDQGKDAKALVDLFNTDMSAAVKQGKTLGQSRVHAYLLQGRGRIVSVETQGIAVSVTDPEDHPELLIRTGPFISGNAVRDASGLVDVSAFDDTMKFNRVSSEINKRLVAQVIKPFLENAFHVGDTVSFVGAAEVAEEATEDLGFGKIQNSDPSAVQYHLLPVVPIRLAME